MVDKKKCTIQPGRPPEGKADCVVKTSADIFYSRIVKEAYVPEPQQFISGAIKTNDIPLLIEFSRVFNLAEGRLIMKIALTGATGFLGRHVVERLSKIHEVRCISRSGRPVLRLKGSPPM